jgi:cytidylate kinase
MIPKKLTIAIDGHSSCGKSTLAKAIAAKFSYKYIDSGAMYRAVTLYAVKNQYITNDKIETVRIENDLNTGKIHIEFKINPMNGKSDTFLNGQCVEKEIRGVEVSGFVSRIAELKCVRIKMVEQQQAMGAEGGIVMDGRDIGTVVFPDAELKIFLTAKADVRAQRRYSELTEKGEKVSYEEILQNVTMRDQIDSNRTESPLMQAKDAVVIDNSFLTIEQQNNEAFRLVEMKLNGTK